MLHRNNIETVIFDLDGTLRHNVPSADETQFNFAVSLGISNSPECHRRGAQWAHRYWAQSEELAQDIEGFDRLEKPFWENYCTRYFMALGVIKGEASDLGPKLAQRMEEGYNPQSQVHPEDFTTLGFLREAGYKVGLVSNRTNPCNEELQELGLSPYLDFAYVAAEVGAWKPDPAIFNRAFEVTGSSPERIVYIGDNYYADILGAKNAGITPILLDPRGIFPDAECAVIRSLGELTEILNPQHQ
ncbi:MAG: HAD family hydrolase [Anaerolineales bacterium]|nr:HAD family hydrolase [Chloroflexota bacterium]MBL6981480.1 HAD family hydrolase [Anaerolineales bacterium]